MFSFLIFPLPLVISCYLSLSLSSSPPLSCSCSCSLTFFRSLTFLLSLSRFRSRDQSTLLVGYKQFLIPRSASFLRRTGFQRPKGEGRIAVLVAGCSDVRNVVTREMRSPRLVWRKVFITISILSACQGYYELSNVVFIRRLQLHEKSLSREL